MNKLVDENSEGCVVSLPPETLLAEKRSRKDRILLEVMQKLWGLLPDIKGDGEHCFALESGHKCRIRQFSAPYERDGELRYSFDILVEVGLGIDHLEFLVTCSGFGGFVV